MAKKPSTAKTPGEGPERFEDRMAELESLIDQIESGEIGLEASIDAYEKGVSIIESCRGLLASAEQRVEELTERLANDSSDEAAGS
ncbi:MAG: exodeoxyribonuclease VII small subunit [Planctomycetota bacterium]